MLDKEVPKSNRNEIALKSEIIRLRKVVQAQMDRAERSAANERVTLQALIDFLPDSLSGQRRQQPLRLLQQSYGVPNGI